MTDNTFMNGLEKIKDPAEILNWYRNLYHCENETTERGVMARAINDILPEYSRQKAEIAKKDKLLEIADKMVESLKAEVERLRNSFDAQANLIEKKSLAYDRMCVKHRNEIKTAKSEAIKEFADRLYKKLGVTKNYAIDEVLREMVGDDNG